ncbi:MAG: hypothetical protein IT307_05130 [Chloroflexi bacterium]|nr:hypothetical protein [Chloroflexota bacterium]
MEGSAEVSRTGPLVRLVGLGGAAWLSWPSGHASEGRLGRSHPVKSEHQLVLTQAMGPAGR